MKSSNINQTVFKFLDKNTNGKNMVDISSYEQVSTQRRNNYSRSASSHLKICPNDLLVFLFMTRKMLPYISTQ